MDPIIVRQADFDNNPNVFDDYATVFLIYEDIDLRMQTIHGQQSSTFCFRGGSFNHGTLDGYVNLRADSNNIFGSTLYFASSLQLNVPYLRPEWFGAKGDYNPDTHKGTDDTAAISRAVRTAEVLSIKTVKFNAVNYLVSGNGIMIYRGNIILEGSGAMLREEQLLSVYTKEYDNNGNYIKTIGGDQTDIGTKLTAPHEEVDNVYLNKNSAIYCQDIKTKGTEYNGSNPILNRCITCYKGNEYYWRDKGIIEDKDGNQIGVKKEFLRYGVSDPIYIKDLQFICDEVTQDNTESETTTTDSSDEDETKKALPEYLSDSKRCIGIDYQATFSGPTWPVIIERCYFKGFAVAFFLNSEYSYSIHCLTFRDNAFAQNIWCVYSNNYELTFQDDGGPTIQCSWAFEFVDNRCHQNDFLIKMSVHKGLCLIENNNTEGTLAERIPIPSGDDADEIILADHNARKEKYAIDLQIAQRAHAIIKHNHFESNNSSLIRVVGFWGQENFLEATENNTDGFGIAVFKDDQEVEHTEDLSDFNCCRFENLTLKTDMNTIIRNCIIENKLPCEKTLTLDSITETGENNKKLFNFAFLRHRGNKLIENVPFKFVDKEAHGGTVMKVTTPYGQRWMTCSYKTTPTNEHNGDIILDADVYTAENANLVADKRYLNIEIPFYKEGKEGRLNYLMLSLYEPGTTPNDNSSFVNSVNYVKSNRSGFYWIRMQFYLEESFLNGLHVRAHSFPAGRDMTYDSCLYFGAATYVLSSEPLDLNMPLNPHDFDLQPGISANSKAFFRKGDIFISDVFKVTCLQTGYTEVSREFFPYNDGNENIVITKPVLLGTTWTMGDITFIITDLVDTNFVDKHGSTEDSLEYFKYYIRIIKGTYSDISVVNSMSGAFDCVRPVLLGKGTGSSGEMNADIVPYLCEGSTFYSVTDGKMYVRTTTGNWKEL